MTAQDMSPEDKELLARLAAHSGILAEDVQKIVAEARANEQALEAFDRVLDLVLTLGGAALSSQIPGAAFAVPATQAVAKALVDDAIARRLGKR